MMIGKLEGGMHEVARKPSHLALRIKKREMQLK